MPHAPRETSDYDAIHPDGRAIAEFRFAADSLRTVRTGLVNLAYALDEHPRAHGFLVLVEPTITEARLRAEWDRAKAVLKPGVFARLGISLVSDDGHFRGLPTAPPAEIQNWLSQVIESGVVETSGRSPRIDFDFVVQKLLVHQWLTKREPVTTVWIARTAGCSYPTVARVLKRLGSLIARESDRRVSLRFFPREELTRLLARSAQARLTARFADRSGQPRSPADHLRRLEKIRPKGAAIGGVLGAKHYLPELDLVGSPQLDISVHCGNRPLDLEFVGRLDPALSLVSDPLKPASVVVHAVRHADPLFSPRSEGLAWADPVECLLDLYEAGLQAQAGQFLQDFPKEEGRHA